MDYYFHEYDPISLYLMQSIMQTRRRTGRRTAYNADKTQFRHRHLHSSNFLFSNYFLPNILMISAAMIATSAIPINLSKLLGSINC